MLHQLCWPFAFFLSLQVLPKRLMIVYFTNFLVNKRETEKARETAQEKKTNRLRVKQKESYWH
jgi:hypothetical protein